MQICTELRAGCKSRRITGLHSKQQSFILFCHTIVHFAENRQIGIAVHLLPRRYSVLTIKDEVTPVTVADFRFVGNALIKSGNDPGYAVGVQPALVCFWNLQIPAADFHQLVECLNAVHCLFLPPI